MVLGPNNMPKSTITVNPAYPTHYGNVILTAGAGTTCTAGTGLTYGAGTGTNWTNTAVFNTSKVKITDADIEINGLSLRDFMHSVNERMAIMIPNPVLEQEFAELRACADRYRELEQKFLEQKQIWETLKKQDQ
jgi:hypothetical protein